MSNIAIFGYPSCVLPPTEGFTWEYLRKILLGQRVAGVENGVETLRKISTGCTRTLQTEERRQTDGRRQIPKRNVDCVSKCSHL